MAFAFNPITGKLDLVGSGGSGGSQVNSDWNSTSGVSQILNKPTIPAAQVNSDWNASTGVAAILNKPSLFSGAYADLTGTPSTFAPASHTHAKAEITDFPTLGTMAAVNDAPSNGSQYVRKNGSWAVLTGGGGASGDFTSGNLQITSGNISSFDDVQTYWSVDPVGNASFGAITAGSATVGGQTITAPANTSALTASYSVTGANTTPLVSLTGTWNTTGVARGILLNITDTASASSSLLMDLRVGGGSKLSVDKSGYISIPNQGTTSFLTTGTSNVKSWITYSNRLAIGYDGGNCKVGTVSKDFIVDTGCTVSDFSGASFKFRVLTAGGITINEQTTLNTDAANTLAQRNGTAAQTFRLYNTFTDASNYERGVFDWTTNSNSLTIGTQKAGTGTARRVRLNSAEGIDVYCSDTTRTFQFAINQTISFNSFRGAWYSLTTDPTTTDLGSNTWAIYKNTTAGTVKLWVNDGGTMKSVALA